MADTQSENPNVLIHSVPVETNMDIDSLFKAAVEGKINPFKEHVKYLDRLVTPNKNTILHIHITARPLSFVKGIHKLFPNSCIMAQLKRKSSLDFVKKILEMCPDLLWQVNNEAETLLHIAARHGHDDIVELLISKLKETHHNDQEKAVGAARQMLRMTNKAKDTALHEAARFNHEHVVWRLIREDSDYYSYGANEAGETPVYLAAERGYYGILDDFVCYTGEQLAYGGPNGRTALHAAVIRNDLGMTREILYKERTLTRTQDYRQWNPLHYAAHYGYLRLVILLLRFDKSAAYIRDDKGRTALHIAAIRGNADVMKELISCCPGCSEMEDDRGWNVLHFAVECMNTKEILLVLENPFLRNLINKGNHDGKTPLHKLAFNKELFSRDQIDLLNHFKDNGEGNSPSRCDGEEKNKYEDDIIIDNISKAREPPNLLLVATLIATVTFAAGFTVPGGYRVDGSPDPGTPILTRNRAFKAFVITNTTAMMLSSSAVFLHLFVELDTKTKRIISYLKVQFTIFAMYGMVLAFITGTYAFLNPSWGLAISVCILGLIFLLPSWFLLSQNTYRFWLRWIDESKLRSKLKSQILNNTILT